MNKRTLFPLTNPADRARSHQDDLTREHPLFVDPAVEDPRDHIRFDHDLPVGLTLEGQTTIIGLGLRRPELREDRMKLLTQLDAQFSLIALADAYSNISEIQIMAQRARDFISAAMLPDAEFSSMVIDYVANH